MSQIADLEAIHKYLTTANAKVPAALTVQLNWQQYYNSLSWADKNLDDNVIAKARRYRDDFNKANTGITPAGTIAKPVQKLTIKQGSTGPNVVEWQRIIGVSADGQFGPQTKVKTIEWQRSHGLTADGVVGPQTWTKALEPNIFKVVAAAPSTSAPAPKPVVPASVVQSVIASSAPTVKTVSTVKPGTNPQVARPTATTVKLTPSNSSTLREGSTGSAVVSWQKKIGVSPADGNFGSKTKAATIDWQRKHGLTPDGIVGPATIAASMVVASAPNTPINTAGKALDAATNAVSAAPKAITKAVNKLPLWLQITMGTTALGGAVLAFLGLKNLTSK